MRRKVLFVVLVVALAGCGEQKYSVWKVVVVPPTAWLSRRGWTVLPAS